MRILVISLCSLAVVSMVYGAQKQEKKSQPKKQAQTAQHAAQPAHAAGGGGSGKKASTTTHHVQNNPNGRAAIAASNGQKHKKNETSTAVNQGQKGKRAQTSDAANQTHKGKKNQTQAERQTAKAANAGQVNGAGKPNQATRATAAANQNAVKGKFAKNKPVKPQHFNLPKQPNTAKAPPVKFQQGRRIQGSQNWQGQKYAVFRNYQAQWHDRNWWNNHYHNNFVFVFGAPYYWNAGYWFPAWGYNPNAYYAWDGPIYAYNRMPPDQVIANVQSALQQQGYYRGEVDGLIGPLTRGAIADYQRDHGLYTTSTIDQPTLQSLGIA
jgi:Putative peptidoglycan binding domain